MTFVASKFPSLSVFFPAYNDAPSLPALARKTFATLERHVADYEVVVDDGSRDGTGEVIEELRREFSPWLRVVTHARNRGYGGALRSGFAAARKEFVFYTDGDGQYDVAEFPRLLALAGPATGMVNGYKLERHDPRHHLRRAGAETGIERVPGGGSRSASLSAPLAAALGARFAVTAASGTAAIELGIRAAGLAESGAGARALQ